jgi:hypothetical protein
LVHNGTLKTQKELHETYVVDSHAICASIATRGAKETLALIDGAFSLVWFDSRDRSLNICRNYERPLNIIETEGCHIICSEEDMGRWIAKRNNMIIKKSISVVPETLYKFNLEDMTIYHEEHVEYKKDPPYVWKGYNADIEYLPAKPVKNQGIFYVPKCKVKVRAGTISRGGEHIMSMELDALLDQDLPKTVKNPNDYEDLYRFRYYGALEELEVLKDCNYLEGTIQRIVHINGQSRYILEDLHMYIPEAVVFALPNKTEEKEKCQWCDGPMPHPNAMYQYNVCDDCMKDNVLYGSM